MTTADAISGANQPRAAREPSVLTARWTTLRRKLLLTFAFCTAAAALGYAALILYPADISVSTDDAYVGATLAEVTPQIDGIISNIRVHDTQHVRRGDVLVMLDSADANLDVELARAAFTQAQRLVQRDLAGVSAARSKVAAMQLRVAQAQQQLHRRAVVEKSGGVAAEEVSNAQTALEFAKYELAIARHELAAQHAGVQDIDIQANPEILAAKAGLDRAELRLRRTVIRAPVDGIVARSRAQIGQQISAGSSVMSIVPIAELYVEANFKESQLERIRPGQLVTLTSDLYGNNHVFHGIVEGLGGGTGSAFAVIPPQNATGNWIKVVQRLPVRIALNSRELTTATLRVGLSMTATVWTNQGFTSDHARIFVKSGEKVSLRQTTSGPY